MGGGENAPAKGHLLIAIPMPCPDKIIDHLKAAHPRLDITYYETKEGETVPKELFKPVTILYTFNKFPSNPKTESPHLKLVQLISAGVNNAVGSPVWEDQDITLTTSSGIHGPQIAEWVVMTGLVQSHNYNMLYEHQKKHEWAKTWHSDVRDKAGERIGILGYGSIGRQVARLASAMGMKVIAYTAHERKTAKDKRDTGYIVPNTGDPDGTIPSEWYSGTSKDDLHAFLGAGLDWVVVTVPLTPQTRHLLGRDEFRVLSKRRAFLSNISRGGVLNQDDLIEALSPQNHGEASSSLLRGAALDVTSPEPLPSDNPLWSLPNVTVTPHISGQTVHYLERSLDILDINLTRREKGLPDKELINVVNRKQGY